MASPWGSSWGNSWGSSWGITVTGDPWGNSWGASWGSSWGRTEFDVRTDDPWGGSWADSWGESWRIQVEEPEPPEPPVTPPGPDVHPPPHGGPGGGPKPPRPRPRRFRIRLDDKEYIFATLEDALAFIAKAKKALPSLAPEKALELASTGKRIGDAKREEGRSIEMVEAPSSDTRKILEERLAEVDRTYWQLVAKRLKDIEDDDEDLWLLM